MNVNQIVAVSVGGVLLCASHLPAQDIEAVSWATGRSLPSQYFTRVRERPDFFEIRRGWIQREQGASRRAVTGTLPILVVQALFVDSPDPTYSNTEIQQSLFDGPSQNGTVTEFYSEASSGVFTVGGQVLPWVRTALTLSETVGASYGLGEDAKTGEFLTQALREADEVVGFGEFDNDGPDGVPNSGDDDGFVDALAFQFLETSASCGGPAIWPHRSRIANWMEEPFATADSQPDGAPVFVDSYIIQSTVTCDGTELATASTIAHELGHVLGLPDLYDRSLGLLPEQRRWVVGCWSLMAAGAWGCGTALRNDWKRPTHLGAWERVQLGWADEHVLDNIAFQEWTLAPVLTSGGILRIPLTATESFLVEYRIRSGFDRELPADGVLIYHIDEDPPAPDCETCPRTYRVALEEADGNGSLVKTTLQGGNRGEAGDAWGALHAGVFSNATIPPSRLNDGAPTAVTFHEIRIEGSQARLFISTEILAQDRLIQSFLDLEGPSLTEEHRVNLDRIGNDNGRYDIGDLRKYLLENPRVGSPDIVATRGR